MCIIIAKPSGANIPDTDTLDNCYTSNRDGIGIAYNMTGETPHIAKGFMNVKKLQKVLTDRNITKEHNLLIHFRLATHGKKDQGNCHPFPLSPSFDDMRLLNCTCGCAIAHNGVFSGMPASQQHSDTMKFIGGVLASPEVIANLNSPSVKELIRGYCGFSSKLAFLTELGISTIGDFEKSEGVFYSNKQYEGWGKRNTAWDNKEYCQEHEAYDECRKKHKKEGKVWCFRHQIWDFCSWCKTHNIWDDCDHKEFYTTRDIVDSSGNRLLDLRILCEWCNSPDNVKYSFIQKSNLCAECESSLNSYSACDNCD